MDKYDIALNAVKDGYPVSKAAAENGIDRRKLAYMAQLCGINTATNVGTCRRNKAMAAVRAGADPKAAAREFKVDAYRLVQALKEDGWVPPAKPAKPVKEKPVTEKTLQLRAYAAKKAQALEMLSGTKLMLKEIAMQTELPFCTVARLSALQKCGKRAVVKRQDIQQRVNEIRQQIPFANKSNVALLMNMHRDTIAKYWEGTYVSRSQKNAT